MRRSLLLLALLLLQLPVAAQGHAGKIRVAVLPFTTPEGATELRQYGEGTMDSLISGLRNVPQFIMVDRRRVANILKEQAFAQTGLVDPASAVKVGKILQAQVLVAGSIQSFNGQMRITANITDVESGEIKDSKQVTGTNIFDLQDQLAGLFVKEQQVTITPEQQQRLDRAVKSTDNVAAYDFYLKGRKAYLAFGNKAWDEALQWYQKAVAADPDYALAYTGMADIWAYRGKLAQQFNKPTDQAFTQACNYTKKALELNPELAEAHRAYVIACVATPGMPEGQAAIQKALDLNPNDGETWFAAWLAAGHAREPDHPYILKALQLDPDNSHARLAHGRSLFAAGRYEEAVPELQQSIRLSPDVPMAHFFLGASYMRLRRPADAIPELEQTLKLNPNYPNAAMVLQRARMFMGGG
ncbi:MAG: tetratricopeptide repeat protein [Chloroflexi bacterium]|nr:tetratricopeptide repeat protein [Chloroflexota bacterium]